VILVLLFTAVVVNRRRCLLRAPDAYTRKPSVRTAVTDSIVHALGCSIDSPPSSST